MFLGNPSKLYFQPHPSAKSPKLETPFLVGEIIQFQQGYVSGGGDFASDRVWNNVVSDIETFAPEPRIYPNIPSTDAVSCELQLGVASLENHIRGPEMSARIVESSWNVGFDSPGVSVVTGEDPS
jgi:hypothetical protein